MRIRWRGFELPTRVVLEKESASQRYGKFVAEPFERGYGVTVGNSLRRVLLSSLGGAAVTDVRLELRYTDEKGKERHEFITHEFTGLHGVYEDVTDLVLTIKELLIKLPDGERATLRLEKTGPGPVTAGDIQRSAAFEIVNPELKICELTAPVTLVAEMTVKRGRGYRTAEENITPELPVGVIPVDSIFSPVRRVRYRTENTRVGQRTDYDRLILEIWTDGTVEPAGALVEASTILRKHLNPFVKYSELGWESPAEGVREIAAEVSPETELQQLREKLALPISTLDPSVRAENCLVAENIKTLGDLVSRSEAEMLQIKNFGKTSLKELKKKLADLGLSFGMQLPGQLEGPENQP